MKPVRNARLKMLQVSEVVATHRLSGPGACGFARPEAALRAAIGIAAWRSESGTSGPPIFARASVSRLTSHRCVSLPGLKSSIELESGPGGPQLNDRQSGLKLPISETEARLLTLWDGVATATALSARLFVEGLDVEPWQVEQFFVRLSRAGVLSGGAPVVPDFIPAAAGVEGLDDVVPVLRGDLVITRSPANRGTVEVKDPLTERSFTLYDFELSIARMLDGKRTVADVLAAAGRLGIPVTLPTLQIFLQQLRAYQFVDAKAAGGDTTWPKRRQWSAGVREQYQTALRLLRTGKLHEARGFADALVEADPSNEDAIALRHRIIAETAGSNELSIPFDTLHTPVTLQAPTRLDTQSSGVDPFASFGFNSAPPEAAALPPMPRDQRHEEEEPVQAPPRSRRPLLIGGLVLVAGLAVLLHPVDALVLLPCEVQLDELAVPRSPRAGAVGPAEVASGAKVEKGAALARLTLAPDESPEALQARIKELESKLATARPSGSAKDIARAEAAVKKATAAVAAINKLKKKKATKKQLAAIEKKLAPKQKALDAANAALAKLQQGESQADLKSALEQLTAKKVAAAIASERSVITAPAAGLFLAPETAPQKLAENDAFGRIVSPTFKVVTKIPLDPEVQTAVFTTPAGRVDVKVEKGTALLEGELKFVGAKGTLEVASGHTPWLLSLFR